MFDDKIVVIRRNTSGHNYTMGSYYTLGKAAPIGPNASVRLAPLFKPVNRTTVKQFHKDMIRNLFLRLSKYYL